jgi:hypothetical protein
MQVLQIIRGFSDLKVQFQSKTGTTKALKDLRLWFAFKSDLLTLHDYYDHKSYIIIASRNPRDEIWQSYLDASSPGELRQFLPLPQFLLLLLFQFLPPKYR